MERLVTTRRPAYFYSEQELARIRRLHELTARGFSPRRAFEQLSQEERILADGDTRNLARKLTEARAHRHLTPEEVAERAGVSVDTVRDLESGTSRAFDAILTLARIAKALGHPLESPLLGPVETEEDRLDQRLAESERDGYFRRAGIAPAPLQQLPFEIKKAFSQAITTNPSADATSFIEALFDAPEIQHRLAAFAAADEMTTKQKRSFLELLGILRKAE
jgi:transcriptional regulator with XRE-family HTH domain